jgi:GNAT superfamily N-acetyltransferase
MLASMNAGKLFRRRGHHQQGVRPVAEPVHLHPLPPGDVAAVAEVFDGMSPHSRFLRFLAPVPRLTAALGSALADVDQVRHVAWVARIGRRAVGIGRYVRLADQPETAEIALAVVDGFQGRGVGRALLDRLHSTAAGQGVRRFTFAIHPANRRALRLVRAGDAGEAQTCGGLVEGWVPVRPAAGVSTPQALGVITPQGLDVFTPQVLDDWLAAPALR